MTAAPALELVGVTAGYGDNPIVRDFSARLAPGSITTLIGGNGNNTFVTGGTAGTVVGGTGANTIFMTAANSRRFRDFQERAV